VVVNVLGPGKKAIATVRRSSPPLAKGGKAFLHFEASVSQRVSLYEYRSMTCR
jgi:hypothetical protein